MTVIQAARDHDMKIIVPVVAVLEWWRGGYGQQHELERLVVEQLTERIAKIVGNVLAKLHDANPIDAAVMASAASRGDVLYTSDIGALTALQTYFPAVRLFRATGTAGQ
jgi:hypothetical protein